MPTYYFCYMKRTKPIVHIHIIPVQVPYGHLTLTTNSNFQSRGQQTTTAAPSFANKILKPSWPMSSRTVYGHFQATAAQLSSCNRHHIADLKPKILSGALKKSLPPSVLKYLYRLFHFKVTFQTISRNFYRGNQDQESLNGLS